MVSNQSSVARNCSHIARNGMEITEPALRASQILLHLKPLHTIISEHSLNTQKDLSSGFPKNI